MGVEEPGYPPPPRVGDDTPIFPAKRVSSKSAISWRYEGRGRCPGINLKAKNPLAMPTRTVFTAAQ